MPDQDLPRAPQAGDSTEHTLVLLKSGAYGPVRNPPGHLPYRMDHLAEHGFRLVWHDISPTGAAGRLRVAVERRTTPFAQAWASRRDRAAGAATLAMFESEGHGLAMARHLRPTQPPGPLLVVACWLAELSRSSAVRRRLYRSLYRGVDDVVVLSANQRPLLADLLHIDPDRIHPVRFGVDLEELAATAPTDVGPTGTVLAAGRDMGRDWGTLARAVTGTGWKVDLVTRPRQIEGLDLPREVTMRGTLDRVGYLRALAGADMVVVPTVERAYPTGQTVLLEAMALGKACVVTDTPAMREYVTDGETALLVPPSDPAALRSAIERLHGDDALRRSLGTAASARERTEGGAARMWSEVAGVLHSRLR